MEIKSLLIKEKNKRGKRYRMRTPSHDVEEWIKNLLKIGIKEFRYRDLPTDLKIKKMVQRARALELIDQVKKIDGIITWRVTDSRIKTYWGKCNQ